MSTIDELGRAAATELRASLESTIDVEDGLRSLGDTPLAPVVAPSPHPSRRVWLAAVAAAAVIAVGIGFVLRDDDEAVTPATSDTTGSTVEPAPTTTLPEVSSTLIVVPDIGARFPAPIDPCTPREDGTPCNFPLQNDSGVTFALTGPADITVTAPDGSSRVQPLDVPAHGPLVALGPEGEVVYVITVQDGSDPQGRLVAFSLAGDTQGDVLAISNVVVDLSGDSSLVPTRDGLVQMGDVGETTRPAPDDELVLPWLRWDGSETTAPGPFTSFDPATQTVTLADPDGAAVGSWVIPSEVSLHRGMPTVVRGAAGVIVSGFDWVHGEHVVLRLLDGGTAQKVTIPEGYGLAGWWGATPILYDGSDYWYWMIPGYTEPAPASDTTFDPGALFDGAFTSADEALSATVKRLTPEGPCDVAPTATVAQRSGEGPVSAVIVYTSPCDDSVGGGRYEVTVELVDGFWVYTGAMHRSLCVRGSSDDPFLCV